MRRFRTENIREFSPADARLTAAGLQWPERNVKVNAFLWVALWMGGYFAVACAVGTKAIDSPFMRGVSSWSAVLAVCALLGLWIARAKPRAMIFCTDGSIIDAAGEPFATRNGPLTRIADITSIGVFAGDYEHFVVSYARNGKVFTIARGLDQWQAHEVAVALSNAMQEMRDSIGRDQAGTRGRRRQSID
jgi:hypothetical protein